MNTKIKNLIYLVITISILMLVVLGLITFDRNNRNDYKNFRNEVCSGVSETVIYFGYNHYYGKSLVICNAEIGTDYQITMAIENVWHNTSKDYIFRIFNIEAEENNQHVRTWSGDDDIYFCNLRIKLYEKEVMIDENIFGIC